MCDANLTKSSVSARLLSSAIALLVCASVAEAQTDRSRWGAAATVVPVWSIPTGSSPLAKLAEAVVEASDFGVDVEGVDFRIGVVRGRMRAGEWGVSFVRRTMKDGSTQGGFEESCEQVNQAGEVCFKFGDRYIYQDVRMNGIEVNKFIPVVAIKERLQIGVDLAGGVGVLKGTAELQTPRNEFVPILNPQGQFIGQTFVTTIDSTIVDAKTLMVFDPTLLGRVEFAVAGIVSPRLRVRFSVGMNFPGSHVASVGASYFFGRD